MIHSFDSDLAKEYGLVEAILLQNFAFWIAKNEANERNYYDGRYWTYNSIKAFQELFPYLTQKRIRTALDHLVENGLLVTGNYNGDRYNRTLWYAFTEKGKWIYQKGQMEMSEKANGFAPEGKCTNTDNKQQILNTDNKNIYGEFQNVRLTEEEYAKVQEKGLLDLLEELSCYIEQIGQKAAEKKYKSHYAVILNWSRNRKKDIADKRAKSGKLKREPNFDIKEIAQKAMLNDDYDI